MHKNFIFILILVLITSAVYVNFFEKQKPSINAQNIPEITSNDIDTQVDQTFEEINTVKIEISDGKYSKSQINVKKGERVKFIIVNNGTSSHDMYSDLFAPGEIKPNETKEIEITPLEVGEFAFSCEIINCNGHKFMQEGYTIIVS